MRSFVLSVAVLLVVSAATAHAGSCHGTAKPNATPTPAEPTHVGVSVDVETPSTNGVATSVLVNGEEVCSGSAPTGVASSPVTGRLSVHATRKNANREARATVLEAKQARRANRFAAKAGEAAADAAVQERVRQAYE